MHIVCPHCTTSYAIEPATLGDSGRTVRCSRCREVWVARPADAVVHEPAIASASQDEAAAEWDRLARQDASEEVAQLPPHVDSPSIAGGFATDRSSSPHIDGEGWQTMARPDHDAEDIATRPRSRWFHRLVPSRKQRKSRHGTASPGLSAQGFVCAGLAALAAALVIWRVDVVRLLPQTAAFYRAVGLEANLRGVQFKDVAVATETVDGKPVLVITGVIVGQNRKPVDLPRLRFSVRDGHGDEIYAWNTVLDQAVLQPGQAAAFKSRLAAPPVEGKSIDVRFFNKRDIAGGSV